MKLRQTQSQQIKLNIAQKLSTQILQMSAAELEDCLNKEEEQNPVLLVERREMIFHYTGNHRKEDQANWDRLAQVAAPGIGLYDYLLIQLEMSKATPEQRKAAVRLAGFLDENGYLKGFPQQLFEGENGRLFCEALDLLQAMEPAGVAARDLRECILLQLSRNGNYNDLICRLVREKLELLARGQFSAVAKQMNVSQEWIERAWDEIRALEPCPGKWFSNEEQPEIVIPEVEICVDNGEATVKNLDLPYKVTLEKSYQEIFENTAEREVREYLSKQLERAGLLCRCVERRTATLLRIAQKIALHQSRFFAGGELYPLQIGQLAAELDLHASTISRAIQGKYLKCARGVYPFKFFFAKGLRSGGPEISSNEIKSRLETLLKNEDADKPYTDFELSILLDANGMISRRTVAKYRGELGYAIASKRKRRTI